MKDPPYKGMYFTVGYARVIREALVVTDCNQQTFEVGNYQYTTGYGRNKHTYDHGYIRFKLSRQLPHMVLDSKQNNFLAISNLPESFDRQQVLRLEGDFNEHFTLYAPQQYETDALYIFTPDVMATFIDNTAACDAEIIDDELYIYISGAQNLAKHETLQKLFRIAQVVGKRVDHQSDYYKDEAVVSRAVNVVAEPGRRLKTAYRWIVIVPVLVYLGLRFVSTATFENPNADSLGAVVTIVIIAVVVLLIYVIKPWSKR